MGAKGGLLQPGRPQQRLYGLLTATGRLYVSLELSMLRADLAQRLQCPERGGNGAAGLAAAQPEAALSTYGSRGVFDSGHCRAHHSPAELIQDVSGAAAGRR
jgi:hypothetical protein